MLHCRVRSCLRVTRYKIDLRKLPVFNEVYRGDHSTSGCFMGTLPIHVKIEQTTTQGVQWDLTMTQNVVFKEVL